MFFGEVKHQLDSKNRIRIPAVFKNELGNDYVLTKGPIQDVIYVYPLAKYIERTKEVYSYLNPYSSQDALLFQEYMAGRFNGEEDNQGRLLLKEDVREYAKIKKDVVTRGCFDHVEIYSVETFEKSKAGRSYSDVMDDIAVRHKEAKQQNSLT